MLKLKCPKCKKINNESMMEDMIKTLITTNGAALQQYPGLADPNGFYCRECGQTSGWGSWKIK